MLLSMQQYNKITPEWLFSPRWVLWKYQSGVFLPVFFVTRDRLNSFPRAGHTLCTLCSPRITDFWHTHTHGIFSSEIKLLTLIIHTGRLEQMTGRARHRELFDQSVVYTPRPPDGSLHIELLLWIANIWTLRLEELSYTHFLEPLCVRADSHCHSCTQPDNEIGGTLPWCISRNENICQP